MLAQVVREVPQYTREALDARIEGAVKLAVIIEADGAVSDVRITQSLDPTFGLDDEAVKGVPVEFQARHQKRQARGGQRCTRAQDRFEVTVLVAASMKPSKSGRNSPVRQKFSGCHWTPRQNRAAGSSMASITPSGAVALT